MGPITFESYTIYRGDCLDILKHFQSECVDLIYIDPSFKYTDVPIYDYLQALQVRGEDPADYRSIWYYY